MCLIIGIDPGSIKTGYGIIKTDGQSLKHIAHGHILAKGDSIAKRLHDIHISLSRILEEHQPNEAAIEQVFMNNNVQSALKLGQARGAALISLAQFQLPIAEYTPREIKKTAVGYGAATKSQVQFMMRATLKLTETPAPDAADALAIAICHCHHKAFLDKMRKNLTNGIT